MPLPTVALAHPTQVARPFHREDWVYEEKVGGWRMVALKDKGHVRLGHPFLLLVVPLTAR